MNAVYVFALWVQARRSAPAGYVPCLHADTLAEAVAALEPLRETGVFGTGDLRVYVFESPPKNLEPLPSDRRFFADMVTHASENAAISAAEPLWEPPTAADLIADASPEAPARILTVRAPCGHYGATTSTEFALGMATGFVHHADGSVIVDLTNGYGLARIAAEQGRRLAVAESVRRERPSLTTLPAFSHQ